MLISMELGTDWKKWQTCACFRRRCSNQWKWAPHRLEKNILYQSRPGYNLDKDANRCLVPSTALKSMEMGTDWKKCNFKIFRNKKWYIFLKKCKPVPGFIDGAWIRGTGHPLEKDRYQCEFTSNKVPSMEPGTGLHFVSKKYTISCLERF